MIDISAWHRALAQVDVAIEHLRFDEYGALEIVCVGGVHAEVIPGEPVVVRISDDVDLPRAATWLFLRNVGIDAVCAAVAERVQTLPAYLRALEVRSARRLRAALDKVHNQE